MDIFLKNNGHCLSGHIAILLLLLFQNMKGNAFEMYYESNKTLSWYDAYADCMSRNMELAVLSSEAKHSAAITYISSNNTNSTGNSTDLDHIWIGHRYFVDKKEYRWINGLNLLDPNAYIWWCPREPKLKLCSYIDKTCNYSVVDIECAEKKNYLCAEGSHPIVENHSHAKTVTIGGTANVHCHYYSLYEVEVTWELERPDGTIDVISPLTLPAVYSVMEETKDWFNKTNIDILHISEGEIGTYRCIVKNKFGSAKGPDNLITTDKSYRLEDKLLTNEGAFAKCKSKDMELAIINSQVEHEAIVAHIINKGVNTGTRLWIGMVGDSYAQSLFWINGVDVKYTDWSTKYPLNWTNWVENGTFHDFCVGLDVVDNYTFVGLNCTDQLPCLCTVPSVPTVYATQTYVQCTENTTSIVLECPYTSLWPITGVIWQKTDSTFITVLDENKDPNIYAGGTLNNTSLIINTLSGKAGGFYKCFLVSDYGTGRGHNITVQCDIGDASTQTSTQSITAVSSQSYITLPGSTESSTDSTTTAVSSHSYITLPGSTESSIDSTTTAVSSQSYITLPGSTESSTDSTTTAVSSHSYITLPGSTESSTDSTTTAVSSQSYITLPGSTESTTDSTTTAVKSQSYITLPGSTESSTDSTLQSQNNSQSSINSISQTYTTEHESTESIVDSTSQSHASTRSTSSSLPNTSQTTTSSVITISQTSQQNCVCNCSTFPKTSNYTRDELRVILRPVTEKLRKELLVDATTLSATINKRISVYDSRPSSVTIGVGGIIILVLIAGFIILADVLTICKTRDELKSRYKRTK